MNYRTLGRTGLQVSEIGFGGAPAGLRNYLGTWEPETVDASQQISQAIERAVELGINYFDTAPGYGEGASERMFGQGLRPFRNQVIIATKLFAETEKEVFCSVETSLERLGIEYIDIIQLHGTWYSDKQINQILAPGGVLDGLLKTKDEGLVRWIGFTSEGANGPASRLIGCGAFDVVQICYNLIYQHPYDPSRKAGLLYEAEEQGMGIIAMRTLTSGIFQKWMGKYFPEVMTELSFQKRLNHALLAFLLSNPLIDAALVGMCSVGEVEENVQTCENKEIRVDLDWLHERYIN
jgi:hypothetical protein